MSKPKLVVLTGAGISAESGIKTFRDSNGLWENHPIEDVATPQGWERNPALVLEFYNQRRKQAGEVLPNQAHYTLAALETDFDVQIITQNVDNLHERAGSTNVLHLHGELFKARSTANEDLIVELEHWELKLGDLASDGAQLRPHIVWFGENVPLFETAADIVNTADYLAIIGTSLVVYPAASLMLYTQPNTPIYLVDLVRPELPAKKQIHFIQEKATVGTILLQERLLGCLRSS